jgi:hypothetical protein
MAMWWSGMKHLCAQAFARSTALSLLESRAVPAKKKRGFTQLIRRLFRRSKPRRSPRPFRGAFFYMFLSSTGTWDISGLHAWAICLRSNPMRPFPIDVRPARLRSGTFTWNCPIDADRVELAALPFSRPAHPWHERAKDAACQ